MEDIRSKIRTSQPGEEAVGLIPAAGKGLRLGLPYPKELYPIIRDNRYKPIAQYVLESMVSAGVGHVIFVINETKHQLIGYFGDGSRFDCHISYVVQENRGMENQSKSPGLAHALDSAYHLTRGHTIFFGMPDTILNPPDAYSQILEETESNTNLALGLFPITRPEKSGAVQLDADQLVQRIIDKPKHTKLPYGWACMIWGPRFTDHLHTSLNEWGVTDFAEVMNLAISNNLQVQGVPIQGGSYVDLGTYEDILELERKYRAP